MKSREHFLKQKILVSVSGWQWRARETFTLAGVLMFLLAAVANAATLTVTTASDDGADGLSLRAAIARAFPGDTINFDESLAGQTILLTQGQLTIDKTLTITGPGASLLTIEQGDSAVRVFEITKPGDVTLSGITIQAGGILNESGATVTVDGCIITNGVSSSGGGIENYGKLKVMHSTISGNRASSGGGIYNAGGMKVTDSTISGNRSFQLFSNGGGIVNSGGSSDDVVEVINTTIGNNFAQMSGGGVLNSGVLSLLNSTVSGNQAFEGVGGGILNGGEVRLQNTISAGNAKLASPPPPPGSPRPREFPDDCDGPGFTSLGHNIIGTIGTFRPGCSIDQPSDQVGVDPDKVLGAFLDPGIPSQGRFPLLSGSPAIDAGDSIACPPTDQLGTPRRGICDIGAVEFYPLANDLVLGFIPEPQSFETTSDALGCPSGFVGKFSLTATLAAKQGSPPLSNLFVSVNQLTNNNLLQNADDGPGGVGARLTIPKGLDPEYADGILTYPENIRNIPFTICLTSGTRFTFLVDVLGTTGQ